MKLDDTNARIDRRNAARDKREKEVVRAQLTPPSRGIVSRVLRFIGEKPYIVIIILLTLILILEAFARIDAAAVAVMIEALR